MVVCYLKLPWHATMEFHHSRAFCGRAPISSTDPLYLRADYRDGKRFLVNRNVKPEHVAPLTLMLNATKSNSSPRDEERTQLCL